MTAIIILYTVQLHAGAASLPRYSAHTDHSALTSVDPALLLAWQASPSGQPSTSVSAAVP